MLTSTNTVVVGGGQAGLSVSHYLKRLSVDHVVLEQADKPGEAWRNHRWDSFTLNTPRWQSRLPGVRYGEDDPDGFMPRQEVVAHLDEMAQRLPIRTGARVVAVARDAARGHYVVSIDGGETIRAHNVVIATGLYQTPKIPKLAHNLPAEIKQLHSDNYRNPEQLLPGAVLVVGSAQSGAQIAEELCESGRKVYLATGRAARTPRRYRGKDANWWFAKMGQYDRRVGELPSPKAKFAGKPHISGTRGGHTINLHQFARDGMILLGRLEAVEDGIVKLRDDLHDNLAAADRAEAELVKAVDAYVANAGIVAPEETLPVLRDGFDQEILTRLDLNAAGITNVIWATGYGFDFSMVKLPVVDGDGFPIQTRGVAALPGLFFVGLPWLHTAKSGLIYGLAEDARYVADRIADRVDARDSNVRPALQQSALAGPKPSHAARWVEGVLTLIWWSATSLVLDGFAGYAAGIYPASPPNAPQQAGPQPRREMRRHPAGYGATKKPNMNRTFAMLASAAIAGLLLAAGHAAAGPLPPQVNFVATPASQLRLGMTGDDVIRVMGKVAKETDFVGGSTRTRKLEFTDAIPGQAILSDGKLSRVTLNPFRMEEAALPSRLRQAWPGFASSVVRRALGEPTVRLRHTWFGIEVDQWVFSCPGEVEASVFFRADRVIARAVGRDVPADLFRVDLPSPPQGEGESPPFAPRVGMTETDIKELCGAPLYRVDYVFNGQAASHAVYQTGKQGTFTGFTIVDGVVTEFEDLGRMPDDPSFQGR